MRVLVTRTSSNHCPPRFGPGDPQRLAALRSYDILDTSPEPEFDDIAQMAAQACDAPMAHINFIDADRQWIKAAVGHDAREMPLHFGFCTQTLAEDGILVLPNLKREPELASNPLVTDEPHLRFYAGVPLVTRDGWAIGTLCVLDREPRTLTAQQEFILKALARTVMAQLESRRSAAALRAREAELRLVADAMPVLIGFIDRSFTYRFANAAYQTWTGRAPEDVVGRTIWQVLSAGEFEARLPQIERALAGEEVRFEHNWACPDGQVRVADIRYMPRFAAAGSVDGFYVFVHDVSDRKRVEDLLQTRANRLEAQVAFQTRDRDRIWTLSPVLKVVAAPNGRIESVNPSWTRALGWSEGQTVGRDFSIFVAPEERGATSVLLGRLAAAKPVEDTELSCVTHDGSTRRILWTIVPEDGLLYGFGRDITEQRHAEEALRQAQKMEAVGQLTGGIAHDFNNLLTGIVGSLDMMQTRIAQGRTDTIERYAKAAMSSANRAAALTHRLLAFARRQPLEPKPVNANTLVASLEDLLRRTIGEAISLEIVTAGGLWPTLCDPHQLESAILNLAINARDAMPDGGKLTIETCNTHLDRAYAKLHPGVEPGQYICICVTDTGTGMPPDVIARAFDPFFTTKPMGQGTGLGLSMIYGFARQSEGHAKIYSEVGQGTTVKIYLPRHRGALAAEEAEATGLTEALRAEAGETVLVVEDEPVVRDLIVEVLADLGYRALEAQDGPSGLKVLQSRERIDLLVTDVGLPGLNGRQLADQARETRPELKVLFITGYAENAMFGNGQLDPGMQMITKPFPVEALATRIRAMIES
ncbi:PAS domain-containing protein [Methylobacterium nigriterrae]|uniref:PAS domain-containing protein n=1 Tax=Methylobacterium nigriterrae TaxID=3127512 RepID=UPI003D665A93